MLLSVDDESVREREKEQARSVERTLQLYGELRSLMKES
jgi:hypothetical protein